MRASAAKPIVVTTLEWIATAAGIVCVLLLIKRSLWNYPFAILSVSLFAIVFREAKLYSDALLQLFFIAINLYGWWSWYRSRATAGEVVVERLAPLEQVAALSGMIGLSLAWGAVMARHTDAAFPYVDGTIAMLSVGAQVLLALRKLENWFVWIAVDLIAIPLFAVKGLYPTAFLYVIYLGLSVWGLRDWLRVYRHAGAANA